MGEGGRREEEGKEERSRRKVQEGIKGKVGSKLCFLSLCILQMSMCGGRGSEGVRGMHETS